MKKKKRGRLKDQNDGLSFKREQKRTVFAILTDLQPSAKECVNGSRQFGLDSTIAEGDVTKK